VVSHRRQVLVGAPPERVWELVGDPRTYPEWWPVVVSVDGERLEDGLEYVQVTKTPMGGVESTYGIDVLEDMRELRAHCRLSGSFVHWRLTEARDDTFVEVELGLDPTAKPLKYRPLGSRYARPLYRRWTDEAIEALREALARRTGQAP